MAEKKSLDAEFLGEEGANVTGFSRMEVAYGSGDVTHILTVGYSSIAELESWEDQVATNKPVQDFLKIMDKMVTWKGSKVLTNSKVYDSASDLEQFVTKDFE